MGNKLWLFIERTWHQNEILKSRIYTIKSRIYTIWHQKTGQDRTTGGLSGVDADHLRALSSEVGKMKHKLTRFFFAKQLSEAGKNSKAAWMVLHDFIGKSGRKRGPLCQTFSDGNEKVPGE